MLTLMNTQQLIDNIVSYLVTPTPPTADVTSGWPLTPKCAAAANSLYLRGLQNWIDLYCSSPFPRLIDNSLQVTPPSRPRPE